MGILGELWVKLGLKNEGLNKGLDDSKKKVSGFANYMSKLGGIMAAAFSVKEIGAFTHRTAELANKAAGVRRAFQALNNPNLLADLRRATLGTVDDLQLMQRAVQAKNFKIPLDQLATYLAFATKRANETGQSVDYLVDSIITGLGRQSVMILDNLGISAAEIRDNMKDGASMAEAVGKIIKEQMGEGATEIDKAAQATQRLTTAWTNFQLAVGGGTSGIWNTLKTEAADYLSTLTRILNADGFSGLEKAGMIFGGWNSKKNWNRLLDMEEGAKKRDANRAAIAAMEEERKAKEKQQKEEEAAAKAKAAEEAKRRSQIITHLKDEIEKKEEIRDISANEGEIRQLNNEIAAMKERLRILQMTSEELKKYKEQKLAERNAKTPTLEAMSGMFDPMAMEENKNKGIAILNDATAQWKEKTLQLSEAAIEQQAITLEAINMLNGALTQGVSASLGELANVIAGVEGANVGNVVKALLSPLADAAISAGLLIMTTGKGIEALRDGLTKFFGIGAIAAGAALMAVGVAAKAGLAAIGSGKTGGGYANQNITSYSGGYGVNSNNYQQDNNFALSATLKGQDLLLSIQRTQQNNKR
jgi:ribosomal protein S16